MLKIGIIGAGRMGSVHAEALKGVKDAELHGVYDPAEETVAAFKAKFGVAKAYPSVAALAGDKALDAVLVCNFSDQHHQTMVELLDAGKKTLFCEKALVRQLADGEDLLRRVKQTGAQVMVGHHRRHIPGYAALHKTVAEGRLGKVRMAKAALCANGYARQWGDFFADFERSGGVILDMMSHVFDQLNWYFGAPESASGLSLMIDRSMPLPVDFMSATLKYQSGPICSVEGAWQRYGVGYDKIEVYGDEATAIYDGGDKLHLYRKDEHTEISVGNPPAYAAQMNAFVQMAKTGEPPLNGIQEGFDSVRVALGVIEAAKSGQTFKFN